MPQTVYETNGEEHEDPCAICLEKMHTAPRQPLATCRECEHAFHSACLKQCHAPVRCPLCRAVWTTLPVQRAAMSPWWHLFIGGTLAELGVWLVAPRRQHAAAFVAGLARFVAACAYWVFIARSCVAHWQRSAALHSAWGALGSQTHAVSLVVRALLTNEPCANHTT